MIRVADLEVRRGRARVCHVPALEVRAGERVGVVGPNGSGKSTLLMVIAGLDRTVCGRCEVEVPVRDRVYAHQQPYLFKGSVLGNAGYGLRAHGVQPRAAARVAAEWLERMGLAALAARSVDGLSGGEKRRLALARAFALRPKLLLLDEPLSDLDEGGVALVREAVASLPETTVLVAAPGEIATGLVGRTHPLVRTG